MTREEAIAYAKKELKAAYERAKKVGHKGKTRYIEVLEMSISVLEQEPCDDAISREAVIEWLENATYEDISYAVGTELSFLPSVTQKSGKWIERKNIARTSIATAIELIWAYECSKCGHEVRHKTRFCASCGAKMESEDKE